MAQTVADVMTSAVATIGPQDSVAEAARRMTSADVGDVVVVEAGTVRGILTDRDIAVRLVAADKPGTTPVAEIISETDVATVTPDTPLDQAVTLLRSKAVRRLPVVEDGRPVGVVSLGDLAIERDPDSALADISAARGNT
jgi:CBS domain-containing protein